MMPSARAASFTRMRAPPDNEHGVDLFGGLSGRETRGVRLRGIGSALAAAVTEAAGIGVVGIVLRFHLVVGAALGGRIEVHGDNGGLADENDLAAHLVFIGGNPLRHLFFEWAEAGLRKAAAARTTGRTGGTILRSGRHGALRRFDLNRGCFYRAACGRRPGEHFEFQVLAHGRDDVAGSGFIEPAGVAELPWFQVAVFHAPGCHLRDGPFGRLLVIRGAGDARPVAVGQHVQRVHDLRVLQLFAAHARGCGFVDFVLRQKKNGNAERDEQLSHD